MAHTNTNKLYGLSLKFQRDKKGKVKETLNIEQGWGCMSLLTISTLSYHFFQLHPLLQLQLQLQTIIIIIIALQHMHVHEFKIFKILIKIKAY